MSLQILQLEMAEIRDRCFKFSGYAKTLCSLLLSFTNQTVHKRYRFSFIVANVEL